MSTSSLLPLYHAPRERPSEPHEPPLVFGVRFTQQGQQDLTELIVSPRETVRDVKRRIRILRPELSLDGRPRRLRLIQLGRLLTDGVILVPYTLQLLSRRAQAVQEPIAQPLFDSLEAVTRDIGLNVGSAPKDKGKGKGKDVDKEQHEEEDKVWLHCSVGDVLDDDELESERIQAVQITPLQGFDKLVDAGFSEAEIATMREEFRANSALPVEGDEDEHARALEDQWMEGMTGQNDIVVDPTTSGVYSTLFQGVCVGFFVPFLPFFLFRTQVFSKRMQMAIVLGVAVNLLFGLLRAFS